MSPPFATKRPFKLVAEHGGQFVRPLAKAIQCPVAQLKKTPNAEHRTPNAECMPPSPTG